MSEAAPDDVGVTDTVATVEPEATVTISAASKSWKRMDVVDVERDEWRVPYGTDWATGELTLESGYGNAYRVPFDTGAEDEVARLIRDGDDDTVSIGPVTELAPAEDEPDVACGDCGETFDDRQALAGHQNNWQTDCDSDAGVESDDGPDVDLPDDVTVDDVQEACRTHEDLGAVAYELDITAGRARTITVALECYQHVRDVTGSRYGGGAR